MCVCVHICYDDYICIDVHIWQWWSGCMLLKLHQLAVLWHLQHPIGCQGIPDELGSAVARSSNPLCRAALESYLWRPKICIKQLEGFFQLPNVHYFLCRQSVKSNGFRSPWIGQGKKSNAQTEADSGRQAMPNLQSLVAQLRLAARSILERPQKTKWPISNMMIHVNPGLINHGLLIRWYSPNNSIVMIWYLNGTFPIKRVY